MTRATKMFLAEVAFVLVFAACVLVPMLARAQGAPVPEVPPSFLATALAVAIPLLVGVLRMFWKDKTEARMRVVSMAIEVAYHATTNLAKYTSTTVDDKVATALGEMKKILDANGYSITPADVQVAQVKWSAMHAVEKQALAVATGARPF